jgi:hypothetical protein
VSDVARMNVLALTGVGPLAPIENGLVATRASLG